MRLEVVLQLGFYSLCLTLALLEGGKAQILPEPAPVNCEWSNWSEWGSCNPCTKSKRRSRGIEVFSQFNGNECQGSIADVEACFPTDRCFRTTTTCQETESQCESGTCFNKNLKCNDDFDCEDGTDENECEIVSNPCGRTRLDTAAEGRLAGYGILGGIPRMNPFNNDYFNGRCNKVRNPTTGTVERLPWNVEFFNYETLEEETFSSDIYEDANSLFKELIQERTVYVDGKISATHGLSYGGIDVGFENKITQTINNMAKDTMIKNKSFMRVKGRVQASTYRLRPHELRVSELFLDHVTSLPLEYEKGIYFVFLEDYGTHYSKTGTFGGQYNLIYVLNQDIIKEKNLTPKDIENCVKTGITNGGAHIRPEGCITTLTDTGTKNGKSVVDNVILAVNGGTLQDTANMKNKLLRERVMDIETYRQWARSIGTTPSQISSEPEPIYNLIPAGIPDANTRISNIKAAIQDYVAEYSVCKCKPCQNGGSVTLLDGKCVCLCHPLFEGLACQNFKSDKASQQGQQRPTVSQEGNWACWSVWSNCSGGKRSRTRGCNTQGLDGASCRGDTRSEESC